MALGAERIPAKTIVDKNGIKKPAPQDIRTRVAQFLRVNMAFPDLPKREQAEKMGITYKRMHEIIIQGQALGLIKFIDPLDRIDYELIPKIVDNLNYFLDAKDKTVTIEAAKGTLFRTYQESKGITEGSQTVLALKIEMPEGNAMPILTGHIVGKPKNRIEANSNDSRT